jgi:hypothetical protein
MTQAELHQQAIQQAQQGVDAYENQDGLRADLEKIGLQVIDLVRYRAFSLLSTRHGAKSKMTTAFMAQFSKTEQDKIYQLAATHSADHTIRESMM